MKTSRMQELERELNLKAALGREYFSDESTKLKKELSELRQIEIELILKKLQS